MGTAISAPAGRITIAAMVAGTGGYSQSPAAAQTYAIIPATPFISPVSGTYAAARTVTISAATPGATIYYTIDGSAPSILSPIYATPFSTPSSVATEQVRSFAVSGGVYSSATSATYTIAPLLGAPSFSPVGGSYLTAQSVVISAPSPGQVIHYTTDGTAPNLASPVYTGIPIGVVAGKATIAAMVAGTGGYTQSPTAAQTYAIVPATPFISPTPGTYTTSRTVTILDATPGVIIYYTIDGSQPNLASPVYAGPLSTPSTAAIETVRAFAVAGGVYSSSTSATYTIAPLPLAPAPVLSPASGTYSTNQVVTIADSLPGAFMYYTLDGSAPTAYSTLYSGPFPVLHGQTGSVVVQAVAISVNYLQSNISQSNITVSLADGVVAATTVNAAVPIDTIATGFLGFSHEWGAAQAMMGEASLGINPIYRTLFNTLASTMNGPLLIRIGGGTTDTSGAAASETVEPFAELAQASNATFILSVNLGGNDLSLAEEQAETFTSDMPASALTAIEIGNEPDGYGGNGYRPSTYAYAEFLPQFSQWAQGIRALSSAPVAIAGPTFGGGDWIPDAQQDLSTSVLQADMVTQHKYVACYFPDAPLASDILLQPTSSTAGLWQIQPYAAAAHQKHLQFRIAEMNSVCNGGQAGVSDTFSSALWAIDTMFEDAKAGVDGVNWNTNYNGGPYDLFHFQIWNKNASNVYLLAAVHPLYYGLLLFAQAAGNTAQLLSSSTVTNANIKIWVTVDSMAKAHLVIINKEQSTSGTVQITLPGYSTGSIVRLTGASYLATSGVTIGGQTFDGSQDGTLQGSAITETTSPSNGTWSIPVSAMSAVLVDLQP